MLSPEYLCLKKQNFAFLKLPSMILIWPWKHTHNGILVLLLSMNFKHMSSSSSKTSDCFSFFLQIMCIQRHVIEFLETFSHQALTRPWHGRPQRTLWGGRTPCFCPLQTESSLGGSTSPRGLEFLWPVAGGSGVLPRGWWLGWTRGQNCWLFRRDSQMLLLHSRKHELWGRSCFNLLGLP